MITRAAKTANVAFSNLVLTIRITLNHQPTVTIRYDRFGDPAPSRVIVQAREDVALDP